MQRKITKSAVDAMAPDTVLWDTELRGFGARKRGETVTFFVKTRIRGRQRWVTIGKFGKLWTAETARREAHDILGQCYRDIDVGMERKRARLRQQPSSDVFEEYLRTHVATLKPQTRDSYARILRQRLTPALGNAELAAISAEQVQRLHRSLAATPRLANLAVNVLAAAMSWAADQGYVGRDHKPCAGIKRYRETRRKRPLTGEEAARLAEVLRNAGATGEVSPLILFQIWLVIFTGARRGEISNLRWKDIDRRRKVLTLPDSKTGPKSIILGEIALEVIDLVPRMNDQDLVFPNGAGRALDSYWKVWNRLRQRAGVPDVRIHDLRHSFGSVAVSSGGSLPVLSRLFGHGDTRMTEVYAHVEDQAAALLAETTTRAIARTMGLPVIKDQSLDGDHWSG